MKTDKTVLTQSRVIDEIQSDLYQNVLQSVYVVLITARIRRMGEGNVFSLSTSRGGGDQSSRGGGGVSPAGGGGQSSREEGGGSVQPGGQSSRGGHGGVSRDRTTE